MDYRLLSIYNRFYRRLLSSRSDPDRATSLPEGGLCFFALEQERETVVYPVSVYRGSGLLASTRYRSEKTRLSLSQRGRNRHRLLREPQLAFLPKAKRRCYTDEPMSLQNARVLRASCEREILPKHFLPKITCRLSKTKRKQPPFGGCFLSCHSRAYLLEKQSLQ